MAKENKKTKYNELERIIKYQDREYKQILLPVRQAIELKSSWFHKDGVTPKDDVDVYELMLNNMFDKPYSLDDFISVHEVETICRQASINQYGEMEKQ